MFVLSLFKLDFHGSLICCTNVKYQIDWNKVAHDPILSQEITNCHAARMRYSRFKKQMEGTAPVRRPRNNNGSLSYPRGAKVKKDAAQSPQKMPLRSVTPKASESGYSERKAVWV